MKMLSKVMHILFFLYAASTLSSAPVSAQSLVENAFREAYSSGDYEAGIKTLQKIPVGKTDTQKAFAKGILEFLTAVGGLQSDLHRFGAGNNVRKSWVARKNSLAAFIPIFRLPAFPNPYSEPATYSETRQMLSDFVDRLQRAHDTLESIGTRRVGLEFFPLDVAFDIDKDGRLNQRESLSHLIKWYARLSRFRQPKLSRLRLGLALDSADVQWLKGYCNLLMGLGNFFLAFDFENTYNRAFHAVLGVDATDYGQQLRHLAETPPIMTDAIRTAIKKAAKRIAELKELSSREDTAEVRKRNHELSQRSRALNKLKRQNKTLTEQEQSELAAIKKETSELRPKRQRARALVSERRQLERNIARYRGEKNSSGSRYDSIFDLISFIHSVSWKVQEPKRLLRVQSNFLTMAQLNSVTWELARAESDNDREWLPNAKQTGPFPGLEVTDERIDTWLAFMTQFEAVLKGRVLIPSLRFRQGVNLDKFFKNANRFDLVDFITGYGSIGFAEDGQLWTRPAGTKRLSPFGRNFNAYAIWFN